MANFSVSIPDQRVPFFKELMKNLGFTTYGPIDDSDIPEHHKKIIDQRLKNYKENPDSYHDWQEVKEEFDKKYNV